MFALVIFLTCLFVTLAIGFWAAWSDFKGLIIPNWHSVAIIVSFLVAFAAMKFMGHSVIFSALSSHALAALVIFIITAALFALKTMGAGDSKLSTAFALWIGVSGLPAFMFYMTLVGGLLGLGALVLAKWKPIKNAPSDGWVARVQSGENKVPYGIAISLGALACFVKLGYFGEALLLLAQS